MDQKSEGKRVDQTTTRNGLPTPSNTPSHSVDECGSHHQNSSYRRSTSRCNSTSQTQPDRSNTTSPESAYVLPQHCDPIYEEPAEIEKVEVENSGPVTQPNPTQGFPLSAEILQSLLERFHQQHAGEQRGGRYTYNAGINVPQHHTSRPGHNFQNITMTGNCVVHAGNKIKKGTDPNLPRSHTYGPITMKSVAGKGGKQRKSSSPRLFAGDTYHD